MQSCKRILATDLLFVLAVYDLLFLLLYIQKLEYWFNSSFSLLSVVSHISYSNEEAGFLSEDQFDGPELSQHAALLTIFVYKLRKLLSFQKIVTY